MLTIVLPLSILVLASSAQNLNDGMEICLSRVEARECDGFYGRYTQNKRYLSLNPDRIQVVDEATGIKAESIKLPGKYKLIFDDIAINTQALEFLIGDMRVELVEIPVLGSIQAMPSIIPLPDTDVTRLIGLGERPQRVLKYCDKDSDRVEVDTQYCRYCDLCQVSQEVEADLNQGAHKVLPNINGEGSFANNCTRFEAGRRYRLVRSINLPKPSQVEDGLPPIENSLKNAFDKGEGRMMVRLRLLNEKRQSAAADCNKPSWCTFFGWHQACQCAAAAGSNTDLRKQCYNSQGYIESAELAACYDISFTYDAKVKDPNSNRSVCPRTTTPNTRTTQPTRNIPTTTQANQNPCGSRQWCCARPTRFVSQFGCPAACVNMQPEQCTFS